jgi:hypothetical protein
VRTDDDRIQVEGAQPVQELGPACLVRLLERTRLPGSEGDEHGLTAARRGVGNDETAHVGEALLPYGVLDDHRDDLEAPLECIEPFVPAGRREEVRDDEHERPGR